MKATLSIIVPTLNESGNISKLTHKIDQILKSSQIPYELIIIDDHSTDNTWKIIKKLSSIYPVKPFKKVGKRGKAYSILQGFQEAKGKYLCMIDADLQYPPEAIPDMLQIIESNQGDIVVADRTKMNTTLIRKIMNKGFKLIFGKILHSLDCDVQSGLKIFRREIAQRITITPSPWTFDLEFLLKARDAGYTISSFPITFLERNSGQTKINNLHSSWEIGSSALKLKFRQSRIIPLKKDQPQSGFHFKGHKFIPYTTLTQDQLALTQLTRTQFAIAICLLLILLFAFSLNWQFMLIAFTTIITSIYFVDLLFNFNLVIKSAFSPLEITIPKSQLTKHRIWPKYTILCPLYKESQILPQFTQAMQNLEYPQIKKEVLLLLEEDDQETINIAQNMGLPSYFKIIVVPNSQPKTKPKACNYGLLKASGEYTVIYDAEDIPDPLQLRKAVIAFEQSPTNIKCIQSKLNYYNSTQNILTRLFTAEYSLWFDLILPGLQSIKAPIPLGGTSNHFRVKDLKSLGAWDPFNVTEDADLGMRIASTGGRTLILNSTTMEEANSQYKNWLRQRSRWIKGYMQTYLLHMRNPQQLIRTQGIQNMIIFQIIVGGKILALLINPFLWILTITYFSLRSQTGEFIESLYLDPIFYLGTFSLFIGNALFTYYYFVALAKRNAWHLIPIALLVPIYWMMMSAAAVIAAWELVVKPHYWQKTVHGLHLQHTQKQNQVPLFKPAIT